MRALSAAATGLEAQQTKIENIANDLANVNTDGYKRSSTEFSDLMYQTLKEPGSSLGASTQSPVGVQIGMGVKIGASHKIFEQGPAKMTYNPYDLMIDGPGFFQVTNAQGETLYTRNGAFHLNAQGTLQLSHGAKLVPPLVVPNNAVSLSVSKTGDVRATLANSSEEVSVGQIQLVNFQNENGLLALGDGLYRMSQASGAAVLAVPGESGLGSIQQGALEGSNVNVANSMVDMIAAQRAYEMGTKVMGVADQMLGATVNIK